MCSSVLLPEPDGRCATTSPADSHGRGRGRRPAGGRRAEAVVAIEDLIAADPGLAGRGTSLAPGFFVVDPDADRGRVARRAAEAGGAVVAVVDGHGRFAGLVRPGRAALRPRRRARGAPRAPGRSLPFLRARRRGGTGAGAPAPMHALLAGRPARGDALGAAGRRVRGAAAGQRAPGDLRAGGRLHGGRGRDADGDPRHPPPGRHRPAFIFRRELVTGARIGVFIAAGFLPFAILVYDGSVALGGGAVAAGELLDATVVAIILPWLLNRGATTPPT